jgi:hypothetical protein
MLSSQQDPRRILTYENDSVLLETRRLLLEQSGFAEAPPARSSNLWHASLKRSSLCTVGFVPYGPSFGATCDCLRRFEGEHGRISANRCNRTPRLPH